MKEIAEKLYETHNLTDIEYKQLIETEDKETAELLRSLADETRQKYYGKKVFLRGLIEISSYCRNDCLYCGIRKSNKTAERYRLSAEDIFSCCENGYKLGFRTFVLQGGEDLYFTNEKIYDIIKNIREKYNDCAITLSLGERSEECYRLWKEAGADRYLLRHETADSELYGKLHPAEMSLENRKKCLFTLKKLGYQTGSGFMVGVPFQTSDNLVSDIRFLQKLNPEMIGIGPFVPHHSTPFREEKQGTLELTLRLLSILRLTFPKVLLPSTTALGTIHPKGRELGLQAGGNVVMPNLSPVSVRKKYELYDNKICTGEEAAECRVCLENRINSAGYVVSCERGDAAI